MNNYDTNYQNIIEACIFGNPQDTSIEQLDDLFESTLSIHEIETHIEQIKLKYQNSGIELLDNHGSYRFRTRLIYQEYLNTLHNVKPPKYSRTIMETLAIIAYMQPITRGEIENIRGVATNSNAIQTLLDREWIEVVGHKQIPGKPELLATTSKFLKDLNLNSISELPPYEIPENSNLNIDFIDEYDKDKTE